MSAAYLDRFVDDQRLLASNGLTGKNEEQIPYLRIKSSIRFDPIVIARWLRERTVVAA